MSVVYNPGNPGPFHRLSKGGGFVYLRHAFRDAMDENMVASGHDYGKDAKSLRPSVAFLVAGIGMGES